jgi:predicted ferric reductase
MAGRDGEGEGDGAPRWRRARVVRAPGGAVSDLLHDSRLLWFLSRSTGLVALVLLTLTLVLGITASSRLGTAGWPRFVTQALHRNVSMFVILLLGAHIAVVVIDDYVPIRPVDAAVPFVATYRPIWLGLGVLSVHLLLVLVLTSLLRQRLGYGTWRAVHWIAYLSWPAAVVHGLGTGSDPRELWAAALTAGCGLAVLAAVSWRIVAGWPARRSLRLGAVLVTAMSVAAVVVWARQGPLAPGWGKRAGTQAPAAVAR